MRNFLCLLLPFIMGIFILSSCNKNEGLGGASSIQGYVYNIVYQSDNFSFTIDTIPAVGERVYIIYSDNEDDPVADKDVRTNLNGMFHFEFLRKGNYIVYALSEYPEELNKQKIAEIKHVKVGSGTVSAEPIYIHSGEGYMLSMIKGKVLAQYYDNFREAGVFPAVERRVYLKRCGEDAVLDDVRASDQGVFIFDRVPPGIYEVYTTTEELGDRRKTEPTTPQIIDVMEPHKIYELPNDTIILNL